MDIVYEDIGRVLTIGELQKLPSLEKRHGVSIEDWMSSRLLMSEGLLPLSKSRNESKAGGRLSQGLQMVERRRIISTQRTTEG